MLGKHTAKHSPPCDYSSITMTSSELAPRPVLPPDPPFTLALFNARSLLALVCVFVELSPRISVSESESAMSMARLEDVPFVSA